MVGSGIAGLSAAHFLDPVHDVTLIEADERLGGHSHTHRVPQADGRELAVDSGFLVHNRDNYPNLVRLFDRLGIDTIATDMSFGVSCARCGLEYSGVRPWAQPGILGNPRTLGLMAEITRFLMTAANRVRPDQTIDGFCDSERYSRAFRRHFLGPMVAALWSTAAVDTSRVPAQFAIGFFDQHGMLGAHRLRWHTVRGGSIRYVTALTERLRNPPRVGVPVRAVTRDGEGVEVRFDDDRAERFDAAVLATHADTSLALMDDADGDEREILGRFRFAENETVLHTDPTYLPRRRSARASWNYQVDDCTAPTDRVAVTYDVSRLQRLDGERTYLVTLNPERPINSRHVIARMRYAHPQFDLQSVGAQERLRTIDGRNRVWFCGAWRGYGFHEDGIRSALGVAERLGGGW